MTNPLNTVLFGDVRQTLRTIPERLFHCVVTSPPYWNLRSYLKSDDPMKSLEIGSERTPEEFVVTMVDVFRGVRRVLRDDGVLWLNMGDGYSAGGWECRRPNIVGNGSMAADERRTGAKPDLPDGNQLLMPHRVAMALQADGWILRSTVVWAKKSPMPESIAGVRWRQCRVKAGSSERALAGTYHAESSDTPHGARDGADFASQARWSPCPGCDKCRDTGGLVLRRGKWRPTTAHEYVFMFSNGERYFCDGDAVQEEQSQGTIDRFGKQRFASPRVKFGVLGETRNNADFIGAVTDMLPGQRNPRSVWTLSSEPYKGAHFATFPTELARRCIAASTSSAGCCPGCGAAYAPVVSSERVATRPGENTKTAGRNSRFYKSHDPAHANEEYDAERLALDRMEIGNRDPQRHIAVTRVTGYLPTCKCAAGPAEPCRVLDPFGGSGTVGQVAKHLGRNYVLCELNRDYLPLIEARIETVPRWKRNGKPQPKPIPGQRELFS